LLFGLLLSFLGVSWSIAIDPLYGIVVFGGLFFDVVVYTILLKRRTSWSIVWGGISGAMPVLAGRVLGYGSVDWVGIALSSAVLFWIPTHILTFSMRYHDDYQAANIPTFPSVYGFQFTRVMIAVSSVLAAISMGISMHGISMAWGYLRIAAVLAIILLVLALYSTIRPSERLNFGLFKYASFFMLGSMVMIMVGG
jgi:protoheme IX farnesyltransferase